MIDLDRLARFLEIADTSAHDGEALNAVRHAGRVLRDEGWRWTDLLRPARELETAIEAAQALLAENDMLRAQVAQAEARGGALTTWNEVSATGDRHRSAARWMLDLAAQRRVGLSDWEIGFLTTCAGWTGQLTIRMWPNFDRILARVVSATGLRPPP